MKYSVSTFAFCVCTLGSTAWAQSLPSQSSALGSTVDKLIRPSGQTQSLVDAGQSDADCFLVDANTQARAMELGRVQFSVDPQSADFPIPLLLNCQTAGGSTSTTAVEVDAVVVPRHKAPAPWGVARKPFTGDPMGDTQAQLVAAGFPPDPLRSPDACNRWLSLIALTAMRITGGTVGGTLANSRHTRGTR